MNLVLLWVYGSVVAAPSNSQLYKENRNYEYDGAEAEAEPQIRLYRARGQSDFEHFDDNFGRSTFGGRRTGEVRPRLNPYELTLLDVDENMDKESIERDRSRYYAFSFRDDRTEEIEGLPQNETDEEDVGRAKASKSGGNDVVGVPRTPELRGASIDLAFMKNERTEEELLPNIENILSVEDVIEENPVEPQMQEGPEVPSVADVTKEGPVETEKQGDPEVPSVGDVTKEETVEPQRLEIPEAPSAERVIEEEPQAPEDPEEPHKNLSEDDIRELVNELVNEKVEATLVKLLAERFLEQNIYESMKEHFRQNISSIVQSLIRNQMSRERSLTSERTAKLDDKVQKPKIKKVALKQQTTNGKVQPKPNGSLLPFNAEFEKPYKIKGGFVTYLDPARKRKLRRSGKIGKYFGRRSIFSF